MGSKKFELFDIKSAMADCRNHTQPMFSTEEDLNDLENRLVARFNHLGPGSSADEYFSVGLCGYVTPPEWLVNLIKAKFECISCVNVLFYIPDTRSVVVSESEQLDLVDQKLEYETALSKATGIKVSVQITGNLEESEQGHVEEIRNFNPHIVILPGLMPYNARPELMLIDAQLMKPNYIFVSWVDRNKESIATELPAQWNTDFMEFSLYEGLCFVKKNLLNGYEKEGTSLSYYISDLRVEKNRLYELENARNQDSHCIALLKRELIEV